MKGAELNHLIAGSFSPPPSDIVTVAPLAYDCVFNLKEDLFKLDHTSDRAQVQKLGEERLLWNK